MSTARKPGAAGKNNWFQPAHWIFSRPDGGRGGAGDEIEYHLWNQLEEGPVRKFSFYFDDEVTDATANTPFTKEAWKNPKSFRIKLIEGNGTTDWSKSDRMLTIALPKSAEIEIKYASFWRPEDVDKYNALQPIVSLGNNKIRSLEYARKSLHWMFSPGEIYD